MRSDRVIPNIFYPYPGTVLYDTAKEAGYLPDVISPDVRVPLIQKQFPEHEVLFIEAYFQHFMNRYRRAFAMPGWLGKPYEKWLDRRVTKRHAWSYKLLVKMHDAYAHMRSKIKSFVIDHLPKIYMKLRMIKHRRKAEG